MEHEIKHNPVLNGSTKKTIFVVTIMIGLLTFTSIITLMIIGLEDVGVMTAWRIESILGAFSSTGLMALARMTAKFMDTRTAQEKDKYRIERLKLKNEIKLEKIRIKNK